jgi:hypothetical protein
MLKPLLLIIDYDMGGTVQSNLQNKERKSILLPLMPPYKVEATRHAFIWSPKEVKVKSKSKAKYPLIHDTGYAEKTCEISCIQNQNS